MERFSRRRFLTLGAGAALSVPLLAACGAPAPAATQPPAAKPADASKPADAAKPTEAAKTVDTKPAAATGQVTLRFMRFAGAGWEHDTKFVDDFMKANPNITVKGEDIVYAEMTKKCLALGATGTLADVFAGHNRWHPYLAAKGLCLDLDPMVKAYPKETQFEDIFPSVIEDVRGVGLDRKLYWFPTVVHPAGNAIVMFNLTLMEKAGLKVPTKDWTIKEYEELVRKGADKANGIYGTDVNLGAPLYAAQFARSWGTDPVKGSDDAWLISRDGTKMQFDAGPVKDAFAWYGKFIKEGLVPAQTERAQLLTTGVDHFVAGKALSIAGTVGAPATVRQKIADKFKMDAVLWPKGPHGHRGSALSYNTQSIFSKTKNPDAAYKLLAFITGPEPAFWTGYEGTLHCMARHSAWFNPKLWEKYPVMKDAAEWFEKGVDVYPHLANNRDQELQESWAQEFVGFLDGKEDWDSMLKHAQPKLQEIASLPRG